MAEWVGEEAGGFAVDVDAGANYAWSQHVGFGLTYRLQTIRFDLYGASRDTPGRNGSERSHELSAYLRVSY